MIRATVRAIKKYFLNNVHVNKFNLLREIQEVNSCLGTNFEVLGAHCDILK